MKRIPDKWDFLEAAAAAHWHSLGVVKAPIKHYRVSQKVSIVSQQNKATTTTTIIPFKSEYRVQINNGKEEVFLKSCTE